MIIRSYSAASDPLLWTIRCYPKLTRTIDIQEQWENLYLRYTFTVKGGENLQLRYTFTVQGGENLHLRHTFRSFLCTQVLFLWYRTCRSGIRIARSRNGLINDSRFASNADDQPKTCLETSYNMAIHQRYSTLFSIAFSFKGAKFPWNNYRQHTRNISTVYNLRASRTLSRYDKSLNVSPVLYNLILRRRYVLPP